MDEHISRCNSPKRISKEFVLEDIKVILENNTFQFNDEYYIQTKGTAMGSKFAPIYSTLVLAYLEAKLYELSELDFGTDFRSY